MLFMSNTLELIEDKPYILIDFETCPLKPLLKKMDQIKVTADNVEIFQTFSTKVKKHENDLRSQRHELESRIRIYKVKLLL